MRGASRAYRMSSTEASLLAGDDDTDASAMAAGSATAMSASGAAGGGAMSGAGASEGGSTMLTTTLKDVSRKDRMQRMDQRRMRCVTHTTV